MAKKDRFAPTPPMGWNSWDCYGASVREAEIRANADFMAKHLKEYGWQYVTVDIQWSEPTASGTAYHDLAPLCMDAYGRLLPAENRFPSAAGGKGFAPLAEYVHSLGLKFAIHIMRGVPRQAVYVDCPIWGSDYTCRQAARGNSVCQWNTDMYGFNTAHPAAQAYADSLLALYASWGVDFLKIDDLSAPVYHAEEVEIYRRAIDGCGRPIVFSSSPGNTPLEQAEHCVANLNMWRVSNDFWDHWPSLYQQYGLLTDWNPYMGEGHYPDADMIPIAHLSVRSNEAHNSSRFTQLTRDEQIFMMSLWCMARSPLILGCELTDIDDFSLSLITNPALLAINQHGQENRPLYRRDDCGAWIARCPEGGLYLAHFNLNDTPRAIATSLEELGIQGPCTVTDLWKNAPMGTAQELAATVVPAHGATVMLLR